MARCDSCNLFTSLNFEDPEVESEPAIDSSFEVTATVRIVRTSECCGEEKKEATFELSEDVDVDALAGHVDPETEEPLEGCEIELESDYPEQVEEDYGRYAKSYFGVRIAFRIRCKCQPESAPALFEADMEEC